MLRGIALLFLGALLLPVGLQSATPARAETDTWAKSLSDRVVSVTQTADGGYALTGTTESSLWVAKTDINGDLEWQQQFESGQQSTLASIFTTDDGGYVAAGRIYTEENSDVWVLKLNSNGNVEWEKTYGTSEFESANAIQQTLDGGYVVAATGPGAGVLKLDSAGNLVWEKSYGTAGSQSANAVQQTADGGYIVAGGIRLPELWFNWAWILKLDEHGNTEWQKAYRDTTDDDDFYEDEGQFATSIKQTSDGGYIFAGQTQHRYYKPNGWMVKLDSAGEMEWEKAFGDRMGGHSGSSDILNSVQQTEDGGFIAVGSGDARRVAGVDPHALIIKLDSNGNTEWQRMFGGLWSGVSAHANSVVETSDGGFVVGGSHLLKLDSGGEIDDCDPLSEFNLLIARSRQTISSTLPADVQGVSTNSTIIETESGASDIDLLVTVQCPLEDAVWIRATDDEEGRGDDSITRHGSITVRGFTDSADVKQVKFEVLNVFGNVARTMTIDAPTSPTDPALIPSACGDDPGDDECAEFLAFFSCIGCDPDVDDKGASFRVRATFLDANGNAIGSEEDSVRFDSFFVLPESPIGAVGMLAASIAAMGGFLYFRQGKR